MTFSFWAFEFFGQMLTHADGTRFVDLSFLFLSDGFTPFQHTCLFGSAFQDALPIKCISLQHLLAVLYRVMFCSPRLSHSLISQTWQAICHCLIPQSLSVNLSSHPHATISPLFLLFCCTSSFSSFSFRPLITLRQCRMNVKLWFNVDFFYKNRQSKVEHNSLRNSKICKVRLYNVKKSKRIVFSSYVFLDQTNPALLPIEYLISQAASAPSLTWSCGFHLLAACQRRIKVSDFKHHLVFLLCSATLNKSWL